MNGSFCGCDSSYDEWLIRIKVVECNRKSTCITLQLSHFPLMLSALLLFIMMITLGIMTKRE